MSNVVRFPGGRQATAIPRAEFERLAELALDIVDRIVALLDEHDGDADLKADGSDEPALGAPERPLGPQLVWSAGNVVDLEE